MNLFALEGLNETFQSSLQWCCLCSSRCVMAGCSHASTASCETHLTSSCFSVSFRVCCDSRWKSSGCWSSQCTKRHNFQTSQDHFVQKCSCRLYAHSVSMGVLAFCTKDSGALTMPLFLRCDVKARRATGWSCGVVSASSCYMSDKVKGCSDMNMGKSCRAMQGKSQQQLRCSELRAAIRITVVQERRRNMWEEVKKTVYPLLSREILTLFSWPCSLTSLSGSFGSRFDDHMKGG